MWTKCVETVLRRGTKQCTMHLRSTNADRYENLNISVSTHHHSDSNSYDFHVVTAQSVSG